jgi:molecular chaperone GrpE
MPEKTDEFSIEIGDDLLNEALQAVEKRLYTAKNSDSKKPSSNEQGEGLEQDSFGEDFDFGDVEIDFSELNLDDLDLDGLDIDAPPNETDEALDGLKAQLKKALEKNAGLESTARDARDESKRYAIKNRRLTEVNEQLKMDVRDGQDNLKTWQDMAGQLKTAAKDLEDGQSSLRTKHKRELKEAGIDELSKSLKALLTPLDHIEMSFSHVDQDIKKDTPLHGLRMSVLELQNALKKFNLIKIDAAIGTPFDPESHEAIARQSHPEIEVNRILLVHRSGYRLGQRLLRAAQVSVSSGPEPSESEE